MLTPNLEHIQVSFPKLYQKDWRLLFFSHVIGHVTHVTVWVVLIKKKTIKCSVSLSSAFLCHKFFVKMNFDRFHWVVYLDVYFLINMFFVSSSSRYEFSNHRHCYEKRTVEVWVTQNEIIHLCLFFSDQMQMCTN